MQKLLQALQAGQEIRDPAVWKNRQLTMNLVAAILAGVAVLCKLVLGFDVPEETLQSITEIVTIVLGLVNGYLTIATSKKVGL